MPSDGRFYQVFCRNKNAKGRDCGAYLGDIQTDVPNVSRKYCRSCKRLEEWLVSDDGKVSVSVIPKEIRLKYYEPPVILVGRSACLQS
jgi:hypothetical protein